MRNFHPKHKPPITFAPRMSGQAERNAKVSQNGYARHILRSTRVFFANRSQGYPTTGTLRLAAPAANPVAQVCFLSFPPTFCIFLTLVKTTNKQKKKKKKKRPTTTEGRAAAGEPSALRILAERAQEAEEEERRRQEEEEEAGPVP